MERTATPPATPLLDAAAAAEYLGVASGTLANWRSTKLVRVPFCRVGRRVLYRMADLQEWLDANAVKATERQVGR